MNDFLICFHCGARMKVDGDPTVFFRGEKLRLGDPAFCSRECAINYDPSALTQSKLAGLQAQILVVKSDPLKT